MSWRFYDSITKGLFGNRDRYGFCCHIQRIYTVRLFIKRRKCNEYGDSEKEV